MAGEKEAPLQFDEARCMLATTLFSPLFSPVPFATVSTPTMGCFFFIFFRAIMAQQRMTCRLPAFNSIDSNNYLVYLDWTDACIHEQYHAFHFHLTCNFFSCSRLLILSTFVTSNRANNANSQLSLPFFSRHR